MLLSMLIFKNKFRELSVKTISDAPFVRHVELHVHIHRRLDVLVPEPYLDIF